jgi:transcriptional regulator with XRE-family HTH domain
MDSRLWASVCVKFSGMEKLPLSAYVAENVRRLRKDRRLSLSEVSARMSALGVPLSLNGLSKVELGHRDLRLDELLALGGALDVAPVLLIFPLGHQRQVQLLPEAEAGTWATLKWFTGQAAFPTRIPAAAWMDIDRGLPELAPTLFREHDELVGRWSQIRLQLGMTRNRWGARRRPGVMADEDEDAAEYTERVAHLEDMLLTAEDQLRYHRQRMRKAGFDPGELHPDLAYIDERAD